VVLANRACGGGLVAWKGTKLRDAPGNRYGAYIADSSIVRVSFIALVKSYLFSLAFKSPDANMTAKTAGLCYLGMVNRIIPVLSSR
jgi:hypothetical protein